MYTDLTKILVILQTEQMGRIVNELDTIQFSIKKASQLVKEIGRQVGYDSLCICIHLFQIHTVLFYERSQWKSGFDFKLLIIYAHRLLRTAVS